MKSFEFTGSGLEYFKIWIVNTLLTIITFGFYYPWAKVRNNRYLYANSSIEGKNFEYHATGKQLFIGYLIAAGGFLLYNLLNNLLPLLGIVFLFVFAIIIPVLILKSMRFNLNVTSFNNVRFDFKAGLKESYIVFLALPLIAFLVCSLPFIIAGFIGFSGILLVFISVISIVLYIVAFSYFNVVKNRFLIDFSRYGNTPFDTNLDTLEFMKIIIKTILITFIAFVVFSILFSLIFYLFGDLNKLNFVFSIAKSDAKTFITMLIKLLLPFLFVFYIFVILTSIISFAYYSVKKREYIFSKTTFDNNVSFSSTMKVLPYMFILITNFLIVALSLGFAYPWAKVRVAKYTLKNTVINIDNEQFSKYYSFETTSQSPLADQVNDIFDVGIGTPI